MIGHPTPALGEVAGPSAKQAAGQAEAFSKSPSGGTRLRPARMLVVCGILLAAAVAAGAALVLSNLRERALSDSEQQLQNLAAILAEQTDHAFQAIDLVETSLIEQMQAVGVASGDDYRRKMSGADVQRTLRDKIASLPYVHSVMLIDERGRLINSSQAGPIADLDVSERRYFRALRSDAESTSILSAPVRDPATGGWTAYLARKYAGPNGEFLGLVLGAVDLQYFERFFAGLKLGDEGSISLFRRDGLLLVRHPLRDAPGRSYSREPLFTGPLAYADHAAVRVTSPYDRAERQVAGHALGHYPAVIAVARTVDAALTEWHSAAAFIIGTAALLIVVVGLTILLGIRQLRNYELLIQARAEKDQKVQLDAALDNMRQGLQMYDATGRVVLTNQKYYKHYGIAPDALGPDATIRDVLCLRQAAGTLVGDPDQYLAKMIDRGRVETKLVQLPDGRTMSVTNAPVPGGGWVSTHEDITESTRREASFRLLFDNNPLPMWVYDLETMQFLAINDAAVVHYGYSREQFLAMTVADIRPPGERERLTQHVRELRGAQRGEQIWRHRKADGTDIETAIYSRILRYEGRQAVLVAVRDVTEQRHAEVERDRTRAFLDTVIENVPMTIFVKSALDQRYMLVNRAAEELWGVPRGDVIGRSTHELFTAAAADAIVARDKELLESKNKLKVSTHLVEMPNNDSRLVSSRRIAILGEDGEPQYLIGLIEDITERARSEQRIVHLAHHDALTDLPNRVLFREQLDQALARVGRGELLAVLYLDLDLFKHVNDTLGHPVGDMLLKAVADRLRDCVRTIDSVARLGGDEFAVIQPSIERPSDAVALATRIGEALREPFRLDGHEVVIDVSVGIAIAPMDATARDELLKHADMALYAAKGAGRGTYRFFEPEMNERMQSRHELERDLRQALADGEFELHYQPIVNLRDNSISGCEALLRWNHPTRGMVPPAEFIPVAEEIGLINPLGEWVIRTACATAATWPETVKVSINLSPAQLKGDALLPVVVGALEDSGIPPSRLDFEITESVLMKDTFATLHTLHQLRELGVRIAMDDFGMGHSSLSYLLSFPFDTIKIDRSFIRGVPNGGNALAIVRAVASLANSLEMATIAEGVETERQLEMVRTLGCTEMQGFVFSPPRPAADIARLLASPAGGAASAA
jgi:diguanylate cyclase (GGDEF)-like protein/PAS domain S-box-containing protein